MKNILKLTFAILLLINAFSLFAASSSKSERSTPSFSFEAQDGAFRRLVNIMKSQDLAALQEFIANPDNQYLMRERNSSLAEWNSLFNAIPVRSQNYRASAPLVNLLLQSGLNPSGALCDLYRQTSKDLKNTSQRTAVMDDFLKIKQYLEEAGDTCNISNPLFLRTVREGHNILEQELAQRETQKAQEMFAAPELSRPLLSDIVKGPIAGYLGAPQNPQRLLRERTSEEEEKERTAARTSQTTTAPVKKSNEKSLDDVE